MTEHICTTCGLRFHCQYETPRCEDCRTEEDWLQLFRQASLPYDVLAEMAKNNPPPPEWFDEGDDA